MVPAQRVKGKKGQYLENAGSRNQIYSKSEGK